jgi:NAD(P)-dependent dehydrogenase (short-subunit alcohol dehydrogenase family)
VNISSIYGIVGSAGAAAYHGTKCAVKILSKVGAVHYAEDVIRVNSVHPGVIKTPMIGRRSLGSYCFSPPKKRRS